jgi:hypothetical protein
VNQPAEPENRPTFSTFAKSCIESKKAEWRNAKNGAQWHATIKDYADPVIGEKHLDEIDTDDVLKILNPIGHTKTVTASRLRGRIYAQDLILQLGVGIWIICTSVDYSLASHDIY